MKAPGGFILGLTGGIGSGKSVVAEMFGELGAALVDADAISRQLTAPGGAAIDALRAAFGAGLIGADGGLDRSAMRQLIFADPEAKAKLESLLHPLIRAESQRLCAAAMAAGSPYVVLVVPLLVEAQDYRARVSRLAVVDCSEATQVARVMARNGLARDEVERIMATQASRGQRLAAADDVINNDAGMDQLRPVVGALHRRYLELAGAKSLDL